ncbi:PREDICTED: uncharacterized protein LOC104818356 isoform X2 [Tarenaya hassleriana]|uniref:uncharacterized protein LOC104818356 isoform X2 n=1 Tax=Tarenaya hassleriana TaxID=28532 RepID=UPI00053C63D4|nr:PREDICTED: uncharacterized protein LOC104818356 isoform X2 [Tarenaya hassleriana]
MADESSKGGDTVVINVRSLTGESTTLQVSSDKTIHDLKIALNRSFSPASSSPNFHLFFKGVKLRLNSRVDTLAIQADDFFVLVPFAKKECAQTQKPDFSESSLSTSLNSRAGSSFSDSAYSEMVSEFSSLRDENVVRAESQGIEENGVLPHSFGVKRKRDQEIGPYEFLKSVSQSEEKNAFEGQNQVKLVEVLESVNCLTTPRSAKCLISTETNRNHGGSYPCSCPEWLKLSMEAFTFLNLFTSLLQLRGEKITLNRLEESLARLGKSGIRIGIEDVKNLSNICPKVVRLVTDDLESANYENAIVIVDSPDSEMDGVKKYYKSECKWMPLSKVLDSMKKRGISFKAYLSESIKLLLLKNRSKRDTVVSLEDMITLTKEGRVSSRNEAKLASKSSYFPSGSHSSQSRCQMVNLQETDPLLPPEMVEHLRNGIGSKGQIVHVEDIQPRKAVYVEIPDELSETTKSALKSIGINKLYSHQAESISASLSGKNVVVATMTSSGKSLCYNVPVFEELVNNPASCALYLFPTKALAQDQLRVVLDMSEGHGASINVGVYDGDTPMKDRTRLKNNARLLITNPDMLHMSILPFHGQFNRILSNIRYVVIDEAHTYKGAFGCHTAFILRRLRRLCSHVYGTDPSFIFCTATSANPREHCMELANLSDLELIDNDGSHSSQKLFVLWNPTSSARNISEENSKLMTGTGADSHRTSSPISEVALLFAEMVRHGLRCIAFCRSRKLCELVLCLTREILAKTAPHLVEAISSYRGGYTAEDRRKIEGGLFGGKLCGIAATNALELGIDVGHIDVTLHLGFPGSIASLWQQAGRSGRRERPSLAVYVAFDGPLDQYFMKFPEKLFRSPIECCHIDSLNQQVLEQHLVCAALEHPLSLQYDEKHFGSGLSNGIAVLNNKGFLSSDPSRDSSARIWTYIGHEKIPSQKICIRAIEAVRYIVIDKNSEEVLDEIEESKAFFQVYEGAVYMNQGRTYLVKKLDTKETIAFCEKASVDYYTKTRDYTDIHVMGGNIAYAYKVPRDQIPETTAQAHICRVTTTWFGFYRVRRRTSDVFDVVDLSLPSYSYESQAVWIQVPQPVKSEVEKIFSFRSGLHAACHALLHVVPLYVRCNYSDLAPECPNPHEKRYFPSRILLYDKHSGGTGICSKIQPFFTEILEASLDLLMSCRCSSETGCPNCVQNVACQEYNELIHKDAAIMIIQGVLDAEKSYFGAEA